MHAALFSMEYYIKEVPFKHAAQKFRLQITWNLNSDDRNFFGEPCVSATMALCRSRYYFIAVMGLGITFLYIALGSSASFAIYCSGHCLVLP